jgi:hypothetical protein
MGGYSICMGEKQEMQNLLVTEYGREGLYERIILNASLQEYAVMI